MGYVLNSLNTLNRKTQFSALSGTDATYKMDHISQNQGVSKKFSKYFEENY